MMVHPKYWSLDSIYRKYISDIGLHEDNKKYYKPPFSLEGKIVLDVGAYIGDSAKFFWELGAKKIVCIEPFYFDQLRKNIVKYKINAEVISEKFRLEHLKIPHDFMKMDIEGWEEILLSVNPKDLMPSVLEIHGQPLIERFKEKGWEIVWETDKVSCNAYINNYKLIITARVS
jgi:hypothetical protein